MAFRQRCAGPPTMGRVELLMKFLRFCVLAQVMVQAP